MLILKWHRTTSGIVSLDQDFSVCFLWPHHCLAFQHIWPNLTVHCLILSGWKKQQQQQKKSLCVIHFLFDHTVLSIPFCIVILAHWQSSLKCESVWLHGFDWLISITWLMMMTSLHFHNKSWRSRAQGNRNLWPNFTNLNISHQFRSGLSLTQIQGPNPWSMDQYCARLK